MKTSAPQNSLSPLFRLHPMKAAKVSEISEATASSPIEPKQRVNFHIGNPIQDKQLTAFYTRLTLGAADSAKESNQTDYADEELQQQRLQLIRQAIETCSPYMPRGGFNPQKPNELVQLVRDWFTKQQYEPLDYDPGTESGRKEIVFFSGGQFEDLRVIFLALDYYLMQSKAHIFVAGLEIPELLKTTTKFRFYQSPDRPEALAPALEDFFKNDSTHPAFLFLGDILPEGSRRDLRRLSLKRPLMFIEANDAPNHLSLAREAGLLNRVIRILTPTALNKHLTRSSISIVAGNADFLKIFETVHFQLKGTPSSTEVELLTGLLKNTSLNRERESDLDFEPVARFDNDHGFTLPATEVVTNVVNVLQRKVQSLSEIAKPTIDSISEIGERIQSRLPGMINPFDPFTAINVAEIVDKFFMNFDKPAWQRKLVQAFTAAFLKHHPEYSVNECSVVSGSARTALSLIGFHCGIREAVFPDLSWTYEHCFPENETVSLNEDLSLDVDAIIAKVQQKLEQNAQWRRQGAVVLNNPHNASGNVFAEGSLQRLIKWLLENDITVIDDLSYQNVAPTTELSGPLTIQQLVHNMVRQGILRQRHAKNIITVHSLSKTDCFAGARLTVVNIPNPEIRNRFVKLNDHIQPNVLAIFIAYLFYRNTTAQVNMFWRTRNEIFEQRMSAIKNALGNLPSDRNPYQIDIIRPKGAMYPRMIINELPSGISLDWLASRLAQQGIGLIPLSTFARTARGYEIARKSFRLTLGGADAADLLFQKTRRVLIDLNRLIAEESLNYTRRTLPAVTPQTTVSAFLQHTAELFDNAIEQIRQDTIKFSHNHSSRQLSGLKADAEFIAEYLPQRLELFRRIFADRKRLAETILAQTAGAGKIRLIRVLKREFYKESAAYRENEFRHRLFDRTVHPTQMYALKVDIALEELITGILQHRNVDPQSTARIALELIHEYCGTNVPISSMEEADELVLDLKTMIYAEEWARWQHQTQLRSLISFWGDWDGSSRPSGQGHRLVAAALMENLGQLANFLLVLLDADSSIRIDNDLLDEIRNLTTSQAAFWKLLNEITSLTNQLEKRYHRVLPFKMKMGFWRRLGMKLHLVRDPLTALWHHNDSLERKMVRLRTQRRENLEYYFALNKRLRKTLYGLLPEIEKNLHKPELALTAGFYRSLLRRFMLTPRIHQKMILAQDQFAIDTTVHNIVEINEIAGSYGTPGMVMGLQVSMSTNPEALIELDRKLRSRREEILRQRPETVLPMVCVIPLFEDGETINNLNSYLDRVWEYAAQTQRLTQDTAARFSEIVCELFFAGSDLSQQVSQPSGAMLYREARHRSVRWLAERGLVKNVRIKLGSGEPMQRQGGYYDIYSGRSLLFNSTALQPQMTNSLKDSARRSVEFAQSPLRGVLAGGDFRTFQSNIAEHLRRLSIHDRAELIYHVEQAQKYYEGELVRADEPLQETRLRFQSRGLEELERLTLGRRDEIYSEFVEMVSQNYQQIVYGREEDVVGVHVISYFISRATPTLRDRPTVRPSHEMSDKKGQQVIERLAHTLPLCKHGSLFRAIGHNRGQTVILGVNQLTTGLFRALSEFSGRQLGNTEGTVLIGDRILPMLAVHDILHTLRIYHDLSLQYVKKMEIAFPAGNSSFRILQEDNGSIRDFIAPMQKELLRRQGLDVREFFRGDHINVNILPAFRPDVAILLQPELFNTDFDQLRSYLSGQISPQWETEMRRLMAIPEKVQRIRDQIWQLIQQPIRQQVQSFVELALAIHSLAEKKGIPDIPFAIEPGKVNQLGTEIAGLLSGVMDDYMRQFLIDAVNYLTQIPQHMTDVPIDIIRALRDVERILRIEEQALGRSEQDLLRFYFLKIARLCGENG